MSGWAEHEDEQQVYGPFVQDMIPPRGVLATDMPAVKPRYRKPRIKGVPAVTAGDSEDYRAGGGSWRPVR